MAHTLSLDDRIRGTLLGAAIGAEIGFARCVEPQRFATASVDDVFKLDLSPVKKYRPEVGRIGIASATCLVDAGVRAYLKARGRATPEHFAGVFADHEGIAVGAIGFDALHSVQELLKEGMNPRLSGVGTHPNGLIAAAMPAVGVFHFAHPQYAYLDGVELASVAQQRLGADWAGLCAAAIAAAFEPGANGWTVVNKVRGVAFDHNRDLFYKLDRLTAHVGWLKDEREFIEMWRAGGSAPLGPLPENQWMAYDPISAVLPLLPRFADDPKRLLAMLIAPPPHMNVTTVSAAIGMAIAGALHGPAAFPKKWLAFAEPIAEPWQKLADVTRSRVRTEAKVVAATRQLAEPAVEGDTHSLLWEKVRGCILAGAIGNAMGSPVECLQYWEVDKKFPGGVTGVLEPSRLESEDDNQMAMHLVETYLAREGKPVMARHFGKTWLDRLNRNHFYPFCMGHGYDLLRQGWDARISGHWSVVTGSTVMCMEPVGIYHLADPDYAAIDATAVSYMYQRGLDVTAAAMLAATVAEAFRPTATVDSVLAAALRVAPKSPLRTFDKRRFKSCHEYIRTCLDIADKYTDVLAARKELYDKCLFYHMIDPLELWGLALAMFKISDGDVRQAAIGGTNIGRDSDTIAGRAAMLSGTLRGASSVPAEWVALFPPAALERIDRNAERLARLVGEQKLALLQTRQDVAAG